MTKSSGSLIERIRRMLSDKTSRPSPSKNTLYCSFCGKSQYEVRNLIAGPSVFICDECVELCMDINRGMIREQNRPDHDRSGDQRVPPARPREVIVSPFVWALAVSISMMLEDHPLACRRSIHVLDQILCGGTMPVSFSDLLLACQFVSSGGMGENQAYLDRQSGKIYWHSEFGDNDEVLPDDIDDEKYISSEFFDFATSKRDRGG